MYRVIFHLIIIYSISLLHFRNFKDNNYRQQLDESLSSGKCEQGLIIANSWLREDPYSHYAWYCLGRLRLETALSKSRNEDFMMSLESFEKAIRLYDKDPRYYYWKANTYLYLARANRNGEFYRNFLRSMQLACDLDPMNYFYYSIFFEKIIKLFKDPIYLAQPIPRKLLIESMINSLNRYLELKQFYARKYLIQFCTVLTSTEKDYYRSQEHLHSDILSALELY